MNSQRLSDTDQRLSDTDQRLSDTDQRLSDTDQRLSDTDYGYFRPPRDTSGHRREEISGKREAIQKNQPQGG